MKKKIEHKALDTFLQGIDQRTVKQIFAVMGNVDDGSDVIFPGAFAKTLAERFDDIQALWQHNGGEPPIGVPLVLKELTRTELPGDVQLKYPDAQGGLYGEIEYLDTPRGNEVLTGIMKKAIRKNSIGYSCVKADFTTLDNGNTVRNLREVMLYDVSPVNWGMNRATTNLKSAMPFRDCGIVTDEGAAWSAPTLADFTDSAWGDLSDDDIKRIAAHFAWSANNPPEAFGDLKLPHHQVAQDGTSAGKAVWEGVSAAMGALMGARGGVDIPEADRKAVYEHLAKHYEQFDKTAPDFKFVETCREALSLSALASELKEGRMISASNLEEMQSAVEQISTALDILESLIEAATPVKSIPIVTLQMRARMAQSVLTRAGMAV